MRSYWLSIVLLASMNSVALADDARPAKGNPESVVAEASQWLAGKQLRELMVEDLNAIVVAANPPPNKPGNKKRNCSVKTPSGVCKG